MASQKTTPGYGWRVWAVGVVALGLVALVWGGFDPGQPAPKALPHRAELGYAAAGFMILAGAAAAWRRTSAWGAGALALYYGLVVVALMGGRVILANPTTYVAYSGAAEQLAIAAGGLIVFARGARIDAGLAGWLTRAGQLAFGVCALVFGGAHFVYLSFTIPFVPKWLPPSRTFWAYATGVFHVAGGVAILTDRQARLGAILLTVMFAAFTPLVHLPMLLADHASHANWAENALNLALTGAAWVVADSLGRGRG